MTDFVRKERCAKVTGVFPTREELEIYVIKSRQKGRLLEDIAADVEVACSTVIRILKIAGIRLPVKTCEVEGCSTVLRGKQKKFCSPAHNAKQRLNRSRLAGAKPRAKVTNGRFSTREELETYIRANCGKYPSNKALAASCGVSHNVIVYVLYNKAWN